MWRLLSATLVLALFAGCSVTGVVSGPGPGPTWKCTPIDPLWQELPANPCFRAVLTAENVITLQWRVVNSQPLVYIYDDFGPGYGDIGFKSAVCPSEPQSFCATSLAVTIGGFGRWLLTVEHPGGSQIIVPAAITVPSPFPPTVVTGGSFVDMLAPTSRTITWTADARNAALDQTTQNAWIEKPTLECTMFFVCKRLPRSGPEASFTVPESALNTPGSKSYSVRDCHLPAGGDTKFCSVATTVSFYTGADRFLDPSPLYADAGNDLTISFTNQSGDVRRLFSATFLPLGTKQAYLETEESSFTIDAALLTPGAHTIELMSCVSQTNSCSPRDKLQILVDSKMDWTLGRDYTDDFLTGFGYAVLGNGEPLDITYDSNGGIWLINEFSSSVEHVTPSGTVESLTLPIARQSELTAFAFAPVKPFATGLSGKTVTPAVFSELAERVTRVGSKIWFTQGGGMLGPTTEIKNHSRVISYDPSLSDSPATPYDDRLCAYNIPTDDVRRTGNSQVIGLAATTDRIWIGEGRGILGDRTSVISAFIPDPDSCENLLNFEDPQALANQSLQYCQPGSSAAQDGCMEKILFDGPLSKIKVAHLETDPVDNTVWFTDAGGRYLGNLNPDRDEVIKIYPLPDSHANVSIAGGLPWSLRVDDGAVYFSEYGTRHILRFDKATAAFDEVWIPVATSQVALHSIDIDAATDRLWFTLANELAAPLDKTASTIGYIDLASWRQHVAQPQENDRIVGVIYQGLENIAPASANPEQHQSFRGIAVDPVSGKIALATMWRRQITELTPDSGFRPPH